MKTINKPKLKVVTISLPVKFTNTGRMVVSTQGQDITGARAGRNEDIICVKSHVINGLQVPRLVLPISVAR